MAAGLKLRQLMDYANSQGVSMSELSRRSKLVKQAKKRRQEQSDYNDKQFELLHASGGDWWNN
jgi:hypothetical protein